MRICFLSREYPPETHAGGIGTYTVNTAAALAALDHDVDVISATRGEESSSRIDRVRVHRVRRRTVRPEEGELLAYSRAVAKKVRRLGTPFDIVQASEFGAEAWWFSLRKNAPLITRLATPFVLTERLNGRPNPGRRPVWNWLERRQVLRSDGLFASTRALARMAAKEWDLDQSGIRIIPNSLDLERIVKLGGGLPGPGLPPAAEFLLYFGRLEERKGIRVLARALPAVLERRPGLIAVFAGADLGFRGRPLRDEIRAACGAFADRILFFDNLPQEKLFPLVKRATLVVLPSLWEAFGFVCLEALALGRPVVATSGSGFAEIIVDGESGFLVEPGDIERLAEKILEALGDASRLARISDGARRRARDFDVRKIALDLLDYYRAVGDEWRKRRSAS